MIKLKSIFYATATVLALSATQAHATLLDFVWTGPEGFVASWTQDSNPTPINTSDSVFTQIAVTSGTDSLGDTTSSFSSVYFFDVGANGGFSSGDGIVNTSGDLDFSGTVDVPVFAPGTYSTGSPVGTLVVTAESETTPAPEPVSLAVLATGLAGLGVARRRRAG